MIRRKYIAGSEEGKNIMLTRLRARLTDRQRTRCVFRVADNLAVETARRGKLQSVGDTIPVIEDRVGIKISVAERELESGLLGFTVIEDNTAFVSISPRCITFQHTLAHELGHILLGHNHGAALNLPATPEGCEGLLSGAMAALTDEAATNESAAELFAERLLSLIPEEGENADAVVWRVALQ